LIVLNLEGLSCGMGRPEQEKHANADAFTGAAPKKAFQKAP
jgi:hypothetical protein